MPIYKAEGTKDGLQKYRVQVSYTDATGKYRKLERISYGMRDAHLTEQDLMRKAGLKAAGGDRAPKTVNDLCNEYMVAQNPSVRLTTWDKYATTIRLYIEPTIGSLSTEKLTKARLMAWKVDMSEKGLSVVTCQKAYAVLRAVLNYAVKMDYLEKNPLTAIGNFTDRNFKPKEESIHFYTKDEFLRFIAVAKTHQQSWQQKCCYVFFCLAYMTGMRKGEMNALKWSDIEANVIHVRRSISQKVMDQDNQMLETLPKSRSSYRDVQMPEPLKRILDQHKEEQQQQDGFSENWRVVGGQTVLADTTISAANRKYALEAGLPMIRVHDFRHSHVSFLINEGINIYEIARRLGHSDIAMTLNVYGHLYPKESERALAALNKVEL